MRRQQGKKNTNANSTVKYLWHHTIHEAWGKERLYFWRLSFSPTFDGNKINKQLEKLLEGQKVLSYAYYELTGMYDILLRTWLPETTSQIDFERAMDVKLNSMDLELAEYFAVSQVLMHWVWKEPIELPSVNDIDIRLPDAEISTLNKFADGSVATIYDADEYVKRNLLGFCQRKRNRHSLR